MRIDLVIKNQVNLEVTFMNNFKIVFISISLAIVFNVGYGQFPIGQYFEPTGYTYMIWVKILA